MQDMIYTIEFGRDFLLGPKVDSNNNMDQLISQMNEERVVEEIYFLLSITCFYPIF